MQIVNQKRAEIQKEQHLPLPIPLRSIGHGLPGVTTRVSPQAIPRGTYVWSGYLPVLGMPEERKSLLLLLPVPFQSAETHTDSARCLRLHAFFINVCTPART